MSDIEDTEEGPRKKDIRTPSINYREIARAVSQDEDLDDPFLDGETEENPTEDRDAVRAILIKHFGYLPDQVTDIADDTCQFLGKNGLPISLKAGTDEQGETYLEFMTGVSESRRVESASLKLGVPIAVALAHQTPDKLSRIYNKRKRDPHVNAVGSIEVDQESSGPYPVITKIFSLRSSGFLHAGSHVRGD